MNIKITLPDGAQRSYPKGVSLFEIANSISEGLARAALSAGVNGQIKDLSTTLHEDALVKFFTWNDAEGKQTFWHSSAHLLAEALEFMYPGVKFGIGPPIEHGFYYDVDLGSHTLNMENLAAIEEIMLELARQKSVFVREEVS